MARPKWQADRGNSRRHTFGKQPWILRSGQLPHEFATDLQLWACAGTTSGWSARRIDLFYRLDSTAAAKLSPQVSSMTRTTTTLPRLAFRLRRFGKGRTVIPRRLGSVYDASPGHFVGHAPFNCAFCPGLRLPESGRLPSVLRVLREDRCCRVAGFFRLPGLSDFFMKRSAPPDSLHAEFHLMFRHTAGQGCVQVGYVGAKGTSCSAIRDINHRAIQITAYDTSAAQCAGAVVPTVRSQDRRS